MRAFVELINSSESRDALLDYTYQTICHICKAIDAGNKDEAVIEYMMLPHSLSKVV